MERYVTKEGNDAGEGSRADPWMTLETASPRLCSGDRLLIGPGEYREQLAVRGKRKVKLTAVGKAVVSGWRKLPPVGAAPWQLQDRAWELKLPAGSKYRGVRRVRIDGQELYGNAAPWSYRDRVMRVTSGIAKGTVLDAVSQYYGPDGRTVAIENSPGCVAEGLTIDGGMVLADVKGSNYTRVRGCTLLRQGWNGIASDSNWGRFLDCTFESRYAHPRPSPLEKDYTMELLGNMLQFSGNLNMVRDCVFAGLHHGGVHIQGGRGNEVVRCCFAGADSTYSRPFGVGGPAKNNTFRDCIIADYNVQPQLHGTATRVVRCTFARARQTVHVARPTAWGNNSESYGKNQATQLLFRRCTFIDLQAGALKFRGTVDRPLTAVVEDCRYVRCGDEPVVIGPHATVKISPGLA